MVSVHPAQIPVIVLRPHIGRPALIQGNRAMGEVERARGLRGRNTAVSGYARRSIVQLLLRLIGARAMLAVSQCRADYRLYRRVQRGRVAAVARQDLDAI